MRYPVVIEPGDETTAFGVVVPDLPGCFSAGDTLDEAISNAQEAAAAWIDAVLDAGGAIPAPSRLDAIRASHSFSAMSLLLRISHVLLGQSRQRLRELRRRDQAGPRRHRHRGIVRTLPAQQLPGQRVGFNTCSEKLKSSSATAFAVVVILTWKLLVLRTHRSTTRPLLVVAVALIA
jgi:predicted RNase H-like HicB family nuclease